VFNFCLRVDVALVFLEEARGHPNIVENNWFSTFVGGVHIAAIGLLS